MSGPLEQIQSVGDAVAQKRQRSEQTDTALKVALRLAVPNFRDSIGSAHKRLRGDFR